MKKQWRGIVVMAILLSCCLFGCTKEETKTAEPKAVTPTVTATTTTTTSAVAEAPKLVEKKVSVEEQWAIDNGLYLDESMDALYEKAKQESGEMVVYTISSRTEKVAKKFMETYPGLKVTVYNISSDELKEKFQREYEAGIDGADLIHSKEVLGDWMNDFFKPGILHNYMPDTIYKNVDKSFKAMTPFIMEALAWYYNTESGKPLSSWWEVTTPEYKGKFVMQDAADNTAYLAVYTLLTEHADEMAKAYKDYFGKDIVLDADEPNAGYAFIKRMLANSPINADRSDEVVELVGTKGQAAPPVGYASSVKVRNSESKGWALNYDLNVAPTTGMYVMNFFGIVNNCKHPNIAKMFIRYLMGGDDGKGPGYTSFGTTGTWSVRPENPPSPGNAPLEEAMSKFFTPDYAYIYEHHIEVRDYYIAHLK